MSRAALILMLSGVIAAPARADGWHPLVFSVDGETLAARTAALEAGAGYNGVTGTGGGLSADSVRRSQTWIQGAFGITDRVEVDGAFVFGDAPEHPFGFVQARLDARVRVLGPFLRVPIWVAVGAGYQADVQLQHALAGVLAATARWGRMEVTFDLRAAHYFHAGRDPIDLFVSAGVLVRTTRLLSLGAEYVGEELEAAFDPEEVDVGVRGGRHYVGPTAVVHVLDNRLRVNLTAGVVVLGPSVGPLVRGGIAYSF